MAGEIKKNLTLIKKDLKNHGARTFIRMVFVFLFDTRFRLLLNYRIGYYLRHSNNKILEILSNYYKSKQITKRNCEISYYSELGIIKFVHPIGIVIGQGVIIEDGVEIYQFVTIGTHGQMNKEFKYPIIRENSKIFTGACIIGEVEIGKGAVIGAHSLVNIDVPQSSLAVGIPAKIKKLKIDV